MKILLLGLLFLNLIYSAENLILPSEYDRKMVFGDNQVGTSFLGNISYFYFSKPSLLAKRCNVIQYVQQVYDLVFGMSVEEYLLGKVDFRSRILWGSNQNLTRSAGFEFAGLGVGSHGHEVLDNNYFWLREGWVDLDLSRFMCVDKSINLIMGKIPYSVGRGISYGIVYAELPGFIGTDSSAVIEEFAPAFLLTAEIFSNKNHTLFGDIYCAILTNWAGSYEQNSAPIYEKRIWYCPEEAERGFGHINFALIGRLKYEAINQYGILNVEPYALLNINPEANINLSATSYRDVLFQVLFLRPSQFNLTDFSLKNLNKSKLITIGCMTNWLNNKFCFNFEFAINKGGLKSYGKDNNNLFINNDYVEEISPDYYNSIGLTVNNSAITELFPIIGSPLVTPENQSVINSAPRGAQYNADIIGFTKYGVLKNNFLRFINPKKFDYQGAMGIFDFAFWLNAELALAFTAGFATGGSFDVEQSGPERKKGDRDKPAYLPDFDPSGSYGSFISLQELYTGLWVKSAFGMGGPFPRPSKSIFLNFNSNNLVLLSKELFKDIKFFGCSINFFLSETITFQANILNYWSFCESSVGSEKDLYSIKLNLTRAGFLPKELGLEIFLVANLNLNYINAFISWAVFFPGERYSSPLLNPLDYFDSYYFLNSCYLDYDYNISCVNSFAPDTNKFNPVYLFNAGFSYVF